jgi:hypothetical protein
MKVRIEKITENGDLSRERLVLRVLRDTDVGKFVIFQARFDEDGPTTGVDEVFWFPDKPLHAGDLIVLYTKAGIQSEKIIAGGATTHFFYWGRSETLWDSPDHGAVVVEANDWAAVRANEAASRHG